MTSRVSASERDVRALAGVVSEIRSDVPTQGLPLSLLSDLKDQIPCDFLLCHGYDTTLQQYWFTQQIPQDNGQEGPVALGEVKAGPAQKEEANAPAWSGVGPGRLGQADLDVVLEALRPHDFAVETRGTPLAD